MQNFLKLLMKMLPKILESIAQGRKDSTTQNKPAISKPITPAVKPEASSPAVAPPVEVESIPEISIVTAPVVIEEKLIPTGVFKEVFPKADPIFEETLNTLLKKYKIDTKNRVASFLAQCGHESADFTVFKENLNYSAKGLLKIFPKYFNTETALVCARKPEKIANKVYANRMGNGSEESGDGWKYRGRGLIQLTGKNNYKEFAIDRALPFDTITAYCEGLAGIVDSAIWFWNKNNCNSYADSDDIKAQTKRINGGYIGLLHRTTLYETLKSKLA